MEDRTFKCLLEGGDGGFGDVTRDIHRMFSPQFVTQAGDVLIWHGWEAISLCPTVQTCLQLGMVFLFGWEYLV